MSSIQIHENYIQEESFLMITDYLTINKKREDEDDN